MTFADIPSGTVVFVDANIFVYAFAPHPQFGPPSEQLLERVENGDVNGVTSTHVLSDVAHRLMSLEACAVYGWPFAGIAQRMKRHPTEVQQLTGFRQAVDAILAMGFRVVSSSIQNIQAAAILSQQHGLLSNDALLLALMQEHGIAHLASHDSDFDRVPGITRYEPV